ncbi:MAG TPA: sugar ABC transporter substrate-binding protein [Pseudothermotoga sp.]|nr:sugar ABC transporter substrate-binding protein [Pseudothermotoga sp.]HOK83164.1 sugar ABC transporter substrate-binding protein [Pseudothermotoga sp.]HPP69665.1 sugar ABC transporter substrate-binding protein [Pseudothermotoga sp.]
MRKLLLIVLGSIVLITSTSLLAAVKLKFYCLAWQPGAVDQIYDIVDSWNESHPEIQIEIVWGTWETSDQYLLTNFSAGTAPDIFHTDSEKFREFGLMGFVEPLNDLIDNEMLEDIPKDAWDDCTDRRGNIYGIPWCRESQVIFYNKKLFTRLGIDLPDDKIVTWQQLLEISKRIVQQTNGNTWGILAPLMERFHWTLIEQNGGKVLHVDENGRWKVAIDDRARQAVGYYLSLITEHKVMPSDVISIDYTSLMQGFLNEKYAMVVFGCWNRRLLSEAAGKDFEWGLMWIKNGDNITNAADPQGIGISKSCKYKKEAFEFIKFFTNSKNSADISYKDWLFPVRKSALQDPRFSDPSYDWEFAYKLLKYSKNVKPPMPGFYTFEWKLFVPVLEKVILGKLTLTEAYKEIETRGNELLKQLGLR